MTSEDGKRRNAPFNGDLNGRRQPDAIALLKADHRKVEDLFAEFEGAKTPTRSNTWQQICTELTVHPARRGNLLILHARAR